MSPTTIKELDGLPQGEIRELVKDGDARVREEARSAREALSKHLGGEMRAMGERMGLVEQRLEKVEGRVANTEDLAGQAVKLSQQAVDQNKEILSKFEGLESEVSQVRTEVAPGVVLTTTSTRWVQTAKDFHLDRLFRFLVTAALIWGAFRLTGWLFGPEIRDLILKKVF